MNKIREIEDKQQLEALGSRLAPQEILEILNELIADTSQKWKLLPLMIKMQPHTFSKLLEYSHDGHIELFKEESLTEPIQHQLLIFSHLFENHLSQLQKKKLELSNVISALKSQPITLQDVRVIKKNLQILSQEYESALAILSKGLIIVWNSNRIDLIDRLSKLKDQFHTELATQIGGVSDGQMTGLFLQLEQALHAVYGDPHDSQDLEALEDTDPAIEAFPKFGIWFLEDYQDVGLIEPDTQELSHLNETYVEEQLLLKGEKLLRGQGIQTIKDLKDKQIFSREMLKEFLKKKVSP